MTRDQLIATVMRADHNIAKATLTENVGSATVTVRFRYEQIHADGEALRSALRDIATALAAIRPAGIMWRLAATWAEPHLAAVPIYERVP